MRKIRERDVFRKRAQSKEVGWERNGVWEKIVGSAISRALP